MLKCGTVAIIGKPNTGKSTLLNAFLKTKISIVTHKAQTTRFQIHAILTENDSQIIFIDTPGILDNPKRALEINMLKQAYSAIREVDIILLMIDATKPDLKLYETFKDNPNVCIVVNKIDQESNPLEKFNFEISALCNTNLDKLKEYLIQKIPEGPFLYDPSQITNLNEKLWASEITREKAMLLLHNELPYELHVKTEKWEECDNGSIKIHQTIFVSREGLKKIVIGHKGEKIKKIGTLAREEIKLAFKKNVHLFLFVKIKDKWPEIANFKERILF